jgi:uncharacterized membrane protein
MTTSQRIFVALLVVSAAQVVIYYSQLPDEVASHFDGSGRANGWSPKEMFFLIDLCTMVLVALVFLFLPRTLSRFSDKSINLPNKDYWLAPERREETARVIHDQMCWFGVATLVFLICVFQLVIEANLNPPPVLSSHFIFLLIVYLAFTAWWVIKFIGKFARVPK